MRTKTLLTALAALAAGIITSNAQVYSANIVGYASVSLQANTYSLMVAPLAGTNTSAETLLPALQSGDNLLFWTGTTFYGSTFLSPGTWYDGVNITNAPDIFPGEGFFYQTASGSAETNIFAGTVVLTNQINIPANSYVLVGSTPPLTGSVESTNVLGNVLQSGDNVLLWTGSGYGGSTFLSPGTWYDGVNITNAPTINVGQAFFYQTSSGSSEQWNQNFNPQ